MPLTKKITALLSDKYRSHISILGDFEKDPYTCILDSNNGTIFIITNTDLFSFKDQYRNHWITVIDSFHFNGKEHNPKLGESYTIPDETEYHFTTKEAIVEMAIAYFEKYKYDIA